MSPATDKRRGGVGRQRGLATVEFAIGTLVVLLLMLVSAEVGRIHYSYNALEKAVRNGSRYLSTVALDSASVLTLSDAKLTRTRSLVIGGDFDGGGGGPLLEGLTPDDITIERTDPSGQYVRVSATIDYRPVLGVVSGLGFGEDLDLAFRMKATSVMRVVR